MKTTLDLPDALIKEVKLRALHQGQKLKDAVADLLRKGLAVEGANKNGGVAVIAKDKETGLLVIEGGRTASVSPEELDDILLQQEVEWFNAARR